MKKKRAPMTAELFSRIIDDAKSYGVKEIMPFLNGEPLLYKNFISQLREINEKIPEATVVFFSNGSLLTKEIADELATIKHLGINFSINAISDTARMKVMHLPLQPTIDNILYLKDKKPEIGIGVSCVMDTLYLTPDELQNFVQFWVSKGIKPNLFYNGNWAGKTRTVVNTEGTCHRPESIMTVLSDGKVALCCYDLEGEVAFGDLNTQTIKEVWESEALENYRFLNDAGRRSELKLCASCTTG
jgi:MoaA/NifB/PqqE/SkfB family radical SAM enzyme